MTGTMDFGVPTPQMRSTVPRDNQGCAAISRRNWKSKQMAIFQEKHTFWSSRPSWHDQGNQGTAFGDTEQSLPSSAWPGPVLQPLRKLRAVSQSDCEHLFQKRYTWPDAVLGGKVCGNVWMSEFRKRVHLLAACKRSSLKGGAKAGSIRTN